MNTSYQQPSRQTLGDSQHMTLVNTFLRRVYNWMAAGLALSALVAWFTLTTDMAFHLLFKVSPTGGTTPRMLFWGVFIGEAVMVLVVFLVIRRIRVGTAAPLFAVYAVLNGVTLSLLLLAFTQASVNRAFLITAGTFAITSIWASITKKDLTTWGSFLFMGLIGIIVASLANFLLRWPVMDYVVSLISVGVFTGLTACDTQRLRAIVLEAANEVTGSKMAIIGTLLLYIDIINLFVMMLCAFCDRRWFGARRPSRRLRPEQIQHRIPCRQRGCGLLDGGWAWGGGVRG